MNLRHLVLASRSSTFVRSLYVFFGLLFSLPAFAQVAGTGFAFWFFAISTSSRSVHEIVQLALSSFSVAFVLLAFPVFIIYWPVVLWLSFQFARRRAVNRWLIWFSSAVLVYGLLVFFPWSAQPNKLGPGPGCFFHVAYMLSLLLSYRLHNGQREA